MGSVAVDQLKLGAFVPYRLSIASNMVSDVIATAYRNLFGLSVAEWRLVTVLAERGQATQAQLATATRMDKLTVSRAAIALVDRGLVERAGNPDDKRSNILTLSASGRDLYAQVAPKALALEKQLLAGFSSEERGLLVAMLARLEETAAQLGDAPQASGQRE
jgi:DNA-binding MarR family transcriptional regulator